MGRLRGLFLFALAYAVLLEVMLAAAILFWPEFEANLPALRSLTAPIRIAGEYLDKVEDKGALAYILGQHFFKGCNALGVAAAALFAAPAIAGEVQRGTLEMWLARPFSRNRLLLERYAAGALAVVLPVFLTTLTIPTLAERVREAKPYGPYLACAAHQSLFLLAIYSVTFLLSSLGSNPTKIALVALFVCIFQFALYMIKTATHWSLFRLCDMDVLLAITDDEWSTGIEASLAAVCLLSLLAALVSFQRRTP